MGIELTEAKFRPLTTKEVALGTGKKFGDDELDEYMQRTSGGRAKEAKSVKAAFKKRLANKFPAK